MPNDPDTKLDTTLDLNFDFAAQPPVAKLFDTQAQQVAQRLNTAPKDLNKTTQIRRFYDELVGWQERIGADEDKFKQFEAYVRMLNAKVAYAKGRKLVDDTFENWFRACLQASTNAQALTHFRLHFEAVLGFLKGLRG